MAEFEHPVRPSTNKHLVLMVIGETMEPTDEYTTNVEAVAQAAGVDYTVAKEALREAGCVDTKKTGGPEKSREEKDPKTVRKVFDAILENPAEGLIPAKCIYCPFSNFQQRTAIRNRPTAGCVILGKRRVLIQRLES